MNAAIGSARSCSKTSTPIGSGSSFLPSACSCAVMVCWPEGSGFARRPFDEDLHGERRKGGRRHHGDRDDRERRACESVAEPERKRHEPGEGEGDHDEGHDGTDVGSAEPARSARARDRDVGGSRHDGIAVAFEGARGGHDLRPGCRERVV
ncbi:hypothetical protein [Microbacterium sp. NFH-22A-Y]|uniref:hypothetical protein n=1 Tax=Microbacterium sp. NFH-22A-Y TaxID=2744448 RepID=UPI001F3FFF7B|nr:hypothetical protein [Microbacterium sp. NFH-22A-Y]